MKANKTRGECSIFGQFLELFVIKLKCVLDLHLPEDVPGLDVKTLSVGLYCDMVWSSTLEGTYSPLSERPCPEIGIKCITSV